jgi:hypothetical protein
MFIGKKNGNIVVFNDTVENIKLNAKIKGVTLDSIEETEEDIVPSHTTPIDGIYYKISEVPPVPAEVANAKIEVARQQSYANLSDPITNHMAVIQYRLDTNDYASDTEKTKLQAQLLELGDARKAIRQQIVDDNPYSE